MSDLTLQNPTPEVLMAMGDGLMSAGQFSIAASLYRVALKTAGGALRNQLLVRQSLAALGGLPRAQKLHGALLDLESLGPNVFIGEGLATWFKTIPFYDDARFLEIADRHAGLLPIANWHWNLQTVVWAVRQARNIPGNFVELGVFKGHTTLFCAEYLDFQTWDKRWYLYDTFEGIPDDQLDPGWKESAEKAYGGTFSVEEVQARFAPFPNIEVIKGRVPEILAERPPGPIAFLHMDLNNTTAEIAALEALFDQISPGGVVVFDDFGWMSSRAQYNAETRWFQDRGLMILPLPTGQGLFIKAP